jgi:hypothetical protein
MSGPPKSKNPPEKLRALDFERKAMDLRMAGWSYYAIGAKLGKTTTGAWAAVDRAVMKAEKLIAEDAKKLRAIEVARLDEVHASKWPDAMRGDNKSIEIVLKIMERRSKLQGLDAPTKTEHSGEIAIKTWADLVTEDERAKADTADRGGVERQSKS